MKINLIDKNVFKIGREWKGNKWIDSELVITYSELDMYMSRSDGTVNAHKFLTAILFSGARQSRS